jgi:two-component system, NtrC family, response regulator
MKPPLQLLIVSSRIEAKKALLHVVEGLPINAYTSPTIEQAWEVLMNHPIDVIFCDERLPDGTYPDFLSAVRSDHGTTRFIVLLSSEEWEDYLLALRLGVSDVLRGSFQPTDVELVLIRASRAVGQREELHLSASA